MADFPKSKATKRSSDPANTAAADGPGPSFKRARFGIRLKLLAMVSLTLGTALGGMILMATDTFKEEIVTRVQESNLKLTRILGTNVELGVLNLAHEGRQLLEGGPSRQSQFVIFAGEPSPQGERLTFSRQWINAAFLIENQVDQTKLLDKVAGYTELYRRGNLQDLTLRNVSTDFDLPVLAVAAPGRAADSTTTTLILLDPAGILAQFRSEGITQTYMVDLEGTALAHFDSRLVLARTNMIGEPIVEFMLGSNLTNGQRRYEDRAGVWQLASFQRMSRISSGVVALVAEKDAFAAVYSIQKRNIFLTLAFINGAILVIIFFSGSLTKPIIRLVEAARKIEHGDLDVKLVPKSGDEAGLLTASISQMARGLRERDLVKETFGKFVDFVVAEQAIKGGMKLGGERRTAAILFSDMRGFTARSERLSPEEIVALMNDYFSAMVAAIHQTGGVVDKFIGDAIMAHWGAVRVTKNDTESAIDAALQMRAALIPFNRNRQGLSRVQFGVGISTGTVIAGQVGSKERVEFTVLGEPVNLASRIEEINKRYGTDILISEEAKARVEGIYRLAQTDPIAIRGVGDVQRLYTVLGRLDDPECPRDIHELLAALTKSGYGTMRGGRFDPK